MLLTARGKADSDLSLGDSDGAAGVTTKKARGRPAGSRGSLSHAVQQAASAQLSAPVQAVAATKLPGALRRPHCEVGGWEGGRERERQIKKDGKSATR